MKITKFIHKSLMMSISIGMFITGYASDRTPLSEFDTSYYRRVVTYLTTKTDTGENVPNVPITVWVIGPEGYVYSEQKVKTDENGNWSVGTSFWMLRSAPTDDVWVVAEVGQPNYNNKRLEYFEVPLDKRKQEKFLPEGTQDAVFAFKYESISFPYALKQK